MRNFRDFEVWKRSIRVIKLIYRYTENLPNKEKYNLITQIERAAASISLNISEGCARSSDKEFGRFIEFSLGSANEVENALIICNELGYTDTNKTKEIFEELTVLQKMLYNLNKKLTANC